MRKILLFICLAVSVNQLSAQTIKFDIDAGLNTSTYSEKESLLSKGIPNFGYTTTNTFTEGFHGGILGKVNWNKLAVQTGVIYTVKGGDDHVVQQTPGAFYLDGYGHRVLPLAQIPLNITYNIPLDNCTFFIGGGPYMEILFNGKYSQSYTFTDYTGTTTGIRHGGVPFTQPSYGIHLLEGVSFKNGFSFNVGYEFGLTDVASNGNYIAKNNSLNLSVAYTLFSLKLHHKKAK